MALAKDSGATGSASYKKTDPYEEMLKKVPTTNNPAVNAGANAVITGAKLATGTPVTTSQSTSSATSTTQKPTTTPTQKTTTTPTIVPTSTSTAPATSSVSQTPSVTAGTSIPNSNRNIAAEIEAEMKKDKIDWDKLAQLAQERNDKIASGNMNVESTEELINRLYAQRGTSNQTPTIGQSAQPPSVQQTAAQEERTIQDYIQAMYEAQLQQRIAQLEAARDAALANLELMKSGKMSTLDKAKTNYLTNLTNALNTQLTNLANEQAQIKPYYYDKRNAAAAQSDVGAYNFAQYMAGRGVKGAAAGMPEIYRNAALQGQIGQLNRDETAANAVIERGRSDLQNQYETNRAGILNNYETDLLSLENDYITGRNEILNKYQSDLAAAQSGINAESLKAFIDQMNADRLFKLQESQITGTYGGTPTLEYQKWQADNAYRDKTFDESVRQFDLNYGLDLRNMSLKEAQQKLDEKYRQGQLSLAEKEYALNLAKYAYQKRQDEEEAARANTIAGTYGVNSVYSDAKTMRDNGQSKVQIIDYVMRSGLSDTEINATLSRLGFTDADIDEYERYMTPAYMGEFQRLQSQAR